MIRRDVVVVGAGASGLLAAAEAASAGRSVVVLEGTRRVGAKVLVSGGGACNLTNRAVAPANYLSGRPNFCKAALAGFDQRAALDLFGSQGLDFEERGHGRLFCRQGSAAVVQALLRLGRERGAEVWTDCPVTPEAVEAADDPAARFRLATPRGMVAARSLIAATGGLAWPQLGGGNFGYALARRFGLAVTRLRPGLAPLVAGPADLPLCAELTGIAAVAAVRLGKVRFTEEVLFTHRGVSGPAILQISNYWTPGQAIAIDFFPDGGLEAAWQAKERSRLLPATLVSGLLPARLAEALCRRAGVPAKPLSAFSAKEARRCQESLRRLELIPAGDEGYGKAEVTLGGVETAELDSRTLGARRLPGLHVTGELVDVTGQLGGYNLQWAWSSGVAAGRAAGRME